MPIRCRCVAIAVFDTDTIKIMPIKNTFEKAIEKSSVYSVGSNKVDLDYIKSQEYKEKFNAISENEELNRSIYSRCKAALINESGNYYEDLSILDSKGNLIGSSVSKIKNETLYTPKIVEAIEKHREYSLVAVHNHATNLPPSGSDLTSAGYRKYNFGVVACHNGKLFVYSVKKARPFTLSYIEKLVAKYVASKYNRYEAMVKALEQAEKDFGVEWREIK